MEIIYNNIWIVLEVIIFNFLIFGLPFENFESIFTYTMGLNLGIVMLVIPSHFAIPMFRGFIGKRAVPKDRKKVIVLMVLIAIILVIISFKLSDISESFVVSLNLTIYIVASIVSIILFFISKNYINKKVEEVIK